MRDSGVSRTAWIALLTAFIGGVTAPIAPVDSIGRIGNLRTPRAAHTATTLRTGQVLFVGGMSEGGGSLASTELFDPTANRSLEAGSLSEARVNHTATLLRAGKVLIAGGYNGDYLPSVELFDPATKRFQRIGALQEGRSGHTATLLRDGRVLITGGIGRGWTFLRTAELFDPATNASQPVSPMSVARESHTATLLSDGRVLIIGGHSGRRPNQELHANAELFNPQIGRFEAAGTLITPRHKHDAVSLADGRVLIIGGADRSDRVHYATTEIYDVARRTFVQGPSMANRRYKIAGTSVVLPNGDVLVTSGARSAEILPSRSSQFQEVRGALGDAYRFAAVVVLRGGDVLIAGGYSDSNQNTAGIWRFNRR